MLVGCLLADFTVRPLLLALGSLNEPDLSNLTNMCSLAKLPQVPTDPLSFFPPTFFLPL